MADDKRIIQYPEVESVNVSDYMMMDSASNGTTRYQVQRILSQASAEAQNKVDAEAAVRASADTAIDERVTTNETDIASLKNDLTDTKSATLAANASGNCWYINVGKIVVVTGTIATSAAFSGSSTIASGLPKCVANNGLVYAINNNNGAAVKMYMSSNGEFRTAESVPNAASLRFCFAYISA